MRIFSQISSGTGVAVSEQTCRQKYYYLWGKTDLEFDCRVLLIIVGFYNQFRINNNFDFLFTEIILIRRLNILVMKV